jgi:predicted phage tail protein|tara:strand:+ start:1021 stop:1773 length:753 start_codon:yes stop_codon:yes gene_type:complete
MQHSVYLQGELGEKFGNKFIVSTDNYADIFKCINANRPDFLPYLRKCHEEDVGFIIDRAGEQIDQEDLLLPLEAGDITVAIAPAGSKSGIGKIIAAVVLVFFVLPLIGTMAIGSMTMAQVGALATASGATSAFGLTMAAALGTIGGKMIALLAINLALSGMQQMMAPDPAVDQDSPTNYLFSGGASNSIEGDPIPILYGELRVAGRPISIDIIQGGNGSGIGRSVQDIINNTVTDSANNVNIAQTQTQEK